MHQGGVNSKSYQFKNNVDGGKNGNSSGYVRSSNEGSHGGFPNFSPGYNKTAEMTKSSFHDPPRVA